MTDKSCKAILIPTRGATYKRLLTRESCLSGAAAVLLLAAPSLAWSQDACGANQTGTVICEPGQGPFDDGVRYRVEAPAPIQDLTVVLSDGVSISTTAAGVSGVDLANDTGGAVRISGAGAGIFTQGDNARGVGVSAQGPVSVEVGDVTTTGYRADGVAVDTNAPGGGDITIKTGRVVTLGEASAGIRATSYHGDVVVDAAGILTEGLGSEGIYANSSYGDVTVRTADVKSEARGVVVNAGGAALVTLDNVRTTSQAQDQAYAATAVLAAGTSVEVRVSGTVMTDGGHAYGVFAHSNHVTQDPSIVEPSLTIDVGAVDTLGTHAIGVAALNDSETGDTRVSVGSIVTRGDYAYGAFVASVGGDTEVAAESIVTLGTAAAGLIAYSLYGQTSVQSTLIETNGNGALGMFASGAQGVRVKADQVVTNGTDSAGIFARGGNSYEGGSATVEVREVETRATGSTGVRIQAFSGDAILKAGKVTASGADAVLIEALYGNVDINLGAVTTHGYRAAAVYAVSVGAGDVTIRAGDVVSTGDVSAGLRAKSFNGAVTITTTGAIKISGDGGWGILSQAVGGDTKIETTSVETTGTYTLGIATLVRDSVVSIKSGSIITSGDRSVAVNAFSIGDRERSIHVNVDSIATSGANAHGVVFKNLSDGIIPVSDTVTMPTPARKFRAGLGLAVPGQLGPSIDRTRTQDLGPIEMAPDPEHGDVTLTLQDVRVTGQGAMGVAGEGIAAVRMDVATVSAHSGEAINVIARELASVSVRSAVSSDEASAIALQGADVQVDIKTAAGVKGVNGLVLNAMGRYVAPPTEPDGGVGVLAEPGVGTASVNNAGLLSGSEYAVRVDTGRAVIANSGVIEGAVRLGAQDDILTNDGVFVAERDSDFGDGTDRFINKGTLRVAAATTGPRVIGLLGLERFENAGGLVDLRNGQAGDVLTLPGDYVASGGARLGLDVGAQASDMLVVAGAATGQTSVLLTGLTPGAAKLTPGGPPLIKAGPGSAPQAFVIANPELGFVRYALRYDPVSGGFVLAGGSGASAYRAAKFAAAATDVWRQSADAWSSHLAAQRNARWGGDVATGRTWGQISAASQTRKDNRALADASGAVQGVKLGLEQTYYGFQAGADLVRAPWADGSATLGLTGGYIESDLDFARSDQKARYKTFNLGAYATLTHGSAFVDGLVSFASHDVDAQDSGLRYRAGFKGKSLGARVDLGARLGTDDLAFEPLASLSYVRSSLDDLAALGQTLDFATASGLSGKLGGRVAGRRQLPSGETVVFHVGASAVYGGQVEGLTLRTGGQSEQIDDRRAKVYGQGLVGVSLLTRRGLTVYAEGQGDLGDDYEGATARVGARLSF